MGYLECKHYMYACKKQNAWIRDIEIVCDLLFSCFFFCCCYFHRLLHFNITNLRLFFSNKTFVLYTSFRTIKIFEMNRNVLDLIHLLTNGRLFEDIGNVIHIVLSTMNKNNALIIMHRNKWTNEMIQNRKLFCLVDFLLRLNIGFRKCPK